MPPVDPLVVRHLRTCLPTGNRFIPRGSKPDDRDSAVCPSNIGVILQVRVPLQQLPSFFIRLRPVLPVDAGADLAILRHLVQAPLYRDANVASGASRAVSVDQFQNCASLLAGQRKFAIQALQSFMDWRHVGFEVNGFNDDLNLARTLGTFALRMVSACLWYAPSDERSRPQTHRLTREKKAPQEAAAPLSTTPMLLHGYADVIQIHVSQIPVSVSMIVEVEGRA